MATHDYVIDNQSAPNFRSDLNNALAAIATTNAGTTEPSTTYANQLWVDTTAKQLKIRNEDNDAWIVLADLDQSGDTSAPPDASITFAKLAAAAVVTEAEGIASNDNDTTIPTSAAVKAYVDASNPTTAGAVGTYGVFCIPTLNGSISAGTDYAGAGLRAVQMFVNTAAGLVSFDAAQGGAPTGTWRAMQSSLGSGTSRYPAALFLRIS